MITPEPRRKPNAWPKRSGPGRGTPSGARGSTPILYR